MYGFWIIAIILGSITFVSVIMLIASSLVEHYTTNGDIGDIAYNCKIAFIFITILAFGILLMVCAIGGAYLMRANHEYATFCEMREMIKQIYDKGTELDNIAITTSLIEQNHWLASAKASKERFGNFSPYYYIDIESLEAITI